MRYQRLKFNNYGPHKALEIEFSPCLTGIVGRNGAGKSTVLAGATHLITGASPMPGNKDKNIFDRIGPKDISSVEGTVTHNHDELEIVRGLRGVATQLRIDGGTAILSETKVDAKLAEIFGTSLTLLQDYMFVSQGTIFDVLVATNATRSKAYSQLFGTNEAERRWKLIGDRLTKVEIPQRSEEIDPLRTRIADDREELANLREQRATYEDVKEYRRENDPNAQTVDRYNEYLKIRKDVKRLSQSRADAKETFTNANTGWKKAYRVAKAAKAQDAEAQAEATKAQKVMAVWKAIDKHLKDGEKLRKEYEELARDAAAHSEPKPPNGFVDNVREVEGQCKMLDSQIAWDTKFIKSFDAASETATCPTCATPARALADTLQEAKERLPEYQKQVKELRDRLEKTRDHEKKLTAWKTWKKEHDKNVARNTEARAAWQKADEDFGPQPDQTQEDLLAIIQAAEDTAETLEEAREELKDAATAKDKAKGTLEAIREELNAAVARREALKVEKAEYIVANEALSQTTERVRVYGVLTGQIKTFKKQIHENEETLQRLEDEAKKGEKLRGKVRRLEDVRKVLHRDKLPREVASGYLNLLEDGTNAMLQRFGAGFTIATEKDLSFTAHFPHGSSQHVARLSGGQKVLLALAFRVEVNATFAHDIGFLGLDEPTMFLDSTNVGCLEHALQKLRELSSATGLQCLMVTHERKLARLFDAVVSL